MPLSTVNCRPSQCEYSPSELTQTSSGPNANTPWNSGIRTRPGDLGEVSAVPSVDVLVFGRPDLGRGGGGHEGELAVQEVRLRGPARRRPVICGLRAREPDVGRAAPGYRIKIRRGSRHRGRWTRDLAPGGPVEPKQQRSRGGPDVVRSAAPEGADAGAADQIGRDVLPARSVPAHQRTAEPTRDGRAPCTVRPDRCELLSLWKRVRPAPRAGAERARLASRAGAARTGRAAPGRPRRHLPRTRRPGSRRAPRLLPCPPRCPRRRLSRTHRRRRPIRTFHRSPRSRRRFRPPPRFPPSNRPQRRPPTGSVRCRIRLRLRSQPEAAQPRTSWLNSLERSERRRSREWKVDDGVVRTWRLLLHHAAPGPDGVPALIRSTSALAGRRRRSA